MFMRHCKETLEDIHSGDYESILQDIKNRCFVDPVPPGQEKEYFCPLLRCEHEPKMKFAAYSTHLSDHASSDKEGDLDILNEFVYYSKTNESKVQSKCAAKVQKKKK